MSTPDQDQDVTMDDGLGDVADTVTVQTNSGPAPAATTTRPPNNADVPKPKRLACMICRKRKLRCDGNRPRCATCTRLGHECAYDEVRRKSGPKRGYVKALEERLKQVETLLKTQEPPSAGASARTPTTATKDAAPSITVNNGSNPNVDGTPPLLHIADPSVNLNGSGDPDRWNFTADNSPQPQQPGADTFDFSSIPMLENNFSWEMIGLGLEEPLPPQETIDELHQIYFEKIHPSIPMIHKYRYLAAMNLAPNQRPPICLRYATWTLACSVSEKYKDLRDLFYQRTRKYVESDYVKGFGEHLISVAHAQTHVLLAQYEFKMMYFPRAWMSTGAAVRLCQMMGLHRVDGSGLDVKMCIPPPRDWTEKEERRRTFWMAFTEDRYASIGTGWPMTIDEKDIMTNMPSSEDAFELSRPEQTQTLSECLSPVGAGSISTMGGIALMACMFGRNLLHLHRPDSDDRDNDLNGEFWKRHRSLDNILLNTSLCLPPHLKLPAGLANPNVIFTNMCIHTSTICLHQAAIFKADKNRLPSSVSAESKVRCITAANEIATTMRMISHVDLATVNPFTSFCLYVAARVFVQYLKSRPDESQVADSLRFLLAAMGALKKRNPLTESFLVQLDVDLEALGARIPKLRAAFPRNMETSSLFPEIKGVDNQRKDCHGILSNTNSFLNDDNEVNKSPEIVEIDPNLVASAPQQQPIPSFSSLSGRWPRESSLTVLERMRQNPGDSRFFGSTLMTELLNVDPNGDVSLSPDPSHPPSDRPTPNSVTNSSATISDRQQSGSGSGSGNLTSGSRSGRGSFETSPASSTAQQHQQGARGSSIFGDIVGGGAGFGLPETPKNQQSNEASVATVDGDFSWESFAAGGTGMTPLATGMTPGGEAAMTEGVLRSMLQMGSMEAMDLPWDTAGSGA